MSKHGKIDRKRRITVAALVIGVVGVPSIAMACVNWRDGGGSHQKVAAEGQRNHTGETRAEDATPSAPAPATTSTASPEHTVGQPSRLKKATATKLRTATPPSASASASTNSVPPSAPEKTAPATDVTIRVAELVNAERSKNGCSPLTLNDTLTKAAQAHSEDMAAHQNMSHTGSDGSSPGDRITRAGYDWSAYGENVAFGYTTAEQVMASWMASPGHRANILNCTFKEIGV
ncbi:CAP domain-containing protein, partial [Streptomyces sp. NPDC051133]|uniref:CAP domain-containing protein n=1 Tax=Streptomyces sp. NPDC051133 TaxID=3155521 RepID=UPI00342E5555